MESKELENLVKIRSLKAEPFDPAEFQGLVAQAKNKMADARNEKLNIESRFDLAYNSAHSFALAALRYRGYRPDKLRYVVFQALAHTLNLKPSAVQVLIKCHNDRNLAEYEGRSEIDPKLLAELIDIATIVEKAVAALPAQ